MEKTNSSQLELFASSGDSRKNRSPSHPVFIFLRQHEKKVLLIIGIAIISIFSFSLGVERGRKTALKKNLGAPGTPKIQVPATLNTPAEQVIKEKENIKPAPLQEKDAYTIQLASYKSESFAQREAELLKKKGLSPLVLVKGNYVVLYVGNFANKEKAQALLSEMKKRYKGCYIRRL